MINTILFDLDTILISPTPSFTSPHRQKHPQGDRCRGTPVERPQKPSLSLARGRRTGESTWQDPDIAPAQHRQSAKLSIDTLSPPFTSADKFFTTVYTNCLIGASDLQTEIKPFLSDWGWTDSSESFLQAWYQNQSAINQDLADYITQLDQQGINCGLATNQEKHRLSYLKKHFHLDTIFSRIYASCDLGYLKPQLMFYQLILQDLGVTKKDHILLIDSSESNIDSAIKFGFQSYLYTSFKSFASDIIKIIPSLHEDS